MSAIAKLSAVTIDCPDPARLAEFYRAVTGWEPVYSDDDYVYLSGAGEVNLGLQRVADLPRPAWPGSAKQMHVDFGVTDLAEAERRLLDLGAEKPEFQPGGDKWVVLIDPAGHPFCISLVD